MFVAFFVDLLSDRPHIRCMNATNTTMQIVESTKMTGPEGQSGTRHKVAHGISMAHGPERREALGKATRAAYSLVTPANGNVLSVVIGDNDHLIIFEWSPSENPAKPTKRRGTFHGHVQK